MARTHFFNAERFGYDKENKIMSAELSDLGCIHFPEKMRIFSNATAREVEFTLTYIDRYNFQANYIPRSLDGNPIAVKHLVLFND